MKSAAAKSDNKQKIMQSSRNKQTGESSEILQVKNELITLEDYEIQTIKTEDNQVDEGQNEDASLIYYFEPQEKSNFAINTEKKSKIVMWWVLLDITGVYFCFF